MQLDDAKTSAEVDSVLDEPASMFIINQSSWSIVEPVTVANRAALLQHLMWEEVILRRESNIKAFMQGLSCLNLLELMQKHPELLKPLFVVEPDESELSVDAFLRLIGSLRPQEEAQQRAYDYFMELIIHLGSK